MKYISIFIITAALIVISSCGDDNSNPSNPSTSDTLYTFSLLEASIEPGITGTSFKSTAFSGSILASVVRIEFTVQANADSILGCTASYRDSINGSPFPPSPLTVNVYGPIDTTYNFNLNVIQQPFYAGFNVSMTVTDPLNAIRRYMRFVNVRIIKVS